MNQEKIGKLIAECRKKQHLTQAQLGEKLGVTDKTISKWEKGINAPNISLLNSLSEIFNITTDELLNGEKIKPNKKEKKEKVLDIPNVIKYYVDIGNKKSRRKTTVITIILTLVFILIISFVVLHNNYSNCFVYKIETTDDRLKLNGVLTLTSEEDVLLINSIENIARYDLDEEIVYCYEYTLVSKDTNIYSYGNISNCNFKENDSSILLNTLLKSINIYIAEKNNYDLLLNDEVLLKDELSVRIKYVNNNHNRKELLIPIKLYKIFSNDKFLYNGGDKY